MKDLPRISQRLLGEPWLVTPAWHRHAVAVFRAATSEPAALTSREKKSTNIQPGAEMFGNIAVLPVSGPIGKHLSSFEMDCGGGFCLTRMNSAIDAAVAQGAKTIVFDMDSPGGTVTGVAETANKIASLRDKGVMTIAYTESMACSACYWLAAACDTVYAAPSAIVGSVGVYCAFLDSTEYYKNAGLSWEYFIGQNATMKAAGAEGRSLTDEQRTRIQANVDGIAADFHSHVASRRKGADMEAIKTGDAWRASEAPKGLVDGLVPTLEALLTALTKQS